MFVQQVSARGCVLGTGLLKVLWNYWKPQETVKMRPVHTKDITYFATHKRNTIIREWKENKHTGTVQNLPELSVIKSHQTVLHCFPFTQAQK